MSEDNIRYGQYICPDCGYHAPCTVDGPIHNCPAKEIKHDIVNNAQLQVEAEEYVFKDWRSIPSYYTREYLIEHNNCFVRDRIVAYIVGYKAGAEHAGKERDERILTAIREHWVKQFGDLNRELDQVNGYVIAGFVEDVLCQLRLTAPEPPIP